MARGEIACVVVGADRIAANGDVANKIGTYSLAVLAALPPPAVLRGGAVEHGGPRRRPTARRSRSRSAAATRCVTLAGQRIAPVGVPARYPAFDVTPAALVTAIVTERGVVRRPFGARARRARAPGRRLRAFPRPRSPRLTSARHGRHRLDPRLRARPPRREDHRAQAPPARGPLPPARHGQLDAARPRLRRRLLRHAGAVRTRPSRPRGGVAARRGCRSPRSSPPPTRRPRRRRRSPGAGSRRGRSPRSRRSSAGSSSSSAPASSSRSTRASRRASPSAASPSSARTRAGARSCSAWRTSGRATSSTRRCR